MEKEKNIIYIVQENDTIEKIAEKFHISAIKIMINNNISPKILKKGIVLYIEN